MSYIENTSNRDALLHLAGAMGGTDRYILEMESAGQAQLVNSDRLPTDTHGKDEAFLVIGFTFGDPDPGDPMFRPATLPEGWTRQGSDHAMWSYLLDEKGRQRIAIFYKAAFYDRSAHMSIVSPTNSLSNMLDTDTEPTSLPIDDLLTADVARAYLASEEQEEAERLPRYVDAVAAGRLGQEAVDETRARIARINRMIGMLP